MYADPICELVILAYYESGRADNVLYLSEIKKVVDDFKAFMAERYPHLFVSPTLLQDVLDTFKRSVIWTVDMTK